MVETPLRRWQIEAFDTLTDWEDSRGKRKAFTAAVTMGAGKTRFGMQVANYYLEHPRLRIQQAIVAVPSHQIAQQWLQEANEQGVAIQVFTYHWIFNNQDAFERLFNEKTAFLCDEIHHAGEHKSWGEMLRVRAKNAARYIMLTGTPFRDDECKLPYVRYVKHELQPDYMYSYGDALADGYVRPLTFIPYDAEGQWNINDALAHGTFGDEYKPAEIQRLLNTVIATNTAFMATMINNAHQRLMAARNGMPDAGGIVICRDQEHARQMKRLVQKITHTNPILAISDDKNSDKHLQGFKEGTDHWLIVVGKGKEGLDIPRLRVGVWATNVTRRLTFLQFIGRVVRQRGNGHEPAYIYLPAHPSLIQYAYEVDKMVTHTLEEQTIEEAQRVVQQRQSATPVFTPISADGAAQAPIIVNDLQTQLKTLATIQNLAANVLANTALGIPTSPEATLAQIRRLVELVTIKETVEHDPA